MKINELLNREYKEIRMDNVKDDKVKNDNDIKVNDVKDDKVKNDNDIKFNDVKDEKVKNNKVKDDNIQTNIQNTSFDHLFNLQTETPFRFILNTTNLYKLPYYLSTKYSIPMVGQILIKSSLNPVVEFDTSYFKQIEDASNSNFKFLDLQSSIKILSYDIETLNVRTLKNNPEDPNQEIINIGIGIFNLNQPKPLRRISIISKPIDENDILLDKSIKTYTKTNSTFLKNSITTYKIIDETSSELEYITVNNEREILIYFINIIKSVNPYFITGFNNWGFDDLWIYTKMKQHNILNLFERILGEGAKFQSLDLKLDGQQVKTEYKTWVGGLIQFQDTMYQAIKEDPKRFSDRSRKNLDTMLSVYKIESPYNITETKIINNVETKQLKKHILSKTGLSIFDMWDYFRIGKNIYEIAKYCCQDAWITGVFCIRRNHIGDLIEMSNITYTSILDSLIKAVNIRVMNTSQHYAYKSHLTTFPFMFYDLNPKINRNFNIKPKLGLKEYDYRVYTGGAVKNLKNGREKFIVALDFSSMYPSQKEGSNVDTSSRVDEDIILHPEKYGLEIISDRYFEDNYGPRHHYIIRRKK